MKILETKKKYRYFKHYIYILYIYRERESVCVCVRRTTNERDAQTEFFICKKPTALPSGGGVLVVAGSVSVVRRW